MVKTVGTVVVTALAASAAGVLVAASHGHRTMNQFRRQRRQSLVLAMRPAVLDRDVLPLDIAGFAQALAKRLQKPAVQLRAFRC